MPLLILNSKKPGLSKAFVDGVTDNRVGSLYGVPENMFDGNIETFFWNG